METNLPKSDTSSVQKEQVRPETEAPTEGVVGSSITDSIKISSESEKKTVQHSFKKIDLLPLPELLEKFGVNTKIIKESKTESLEHLAQFLRQSDDKMAGVIIDLVNKKGIKLFEENLSTASIQKQVLLHLGFDPQAIGLYNWADEGEEPEWRSPSDIDINHLYCAVASDFSDKDKIMGLFRDYNMVKIFADTLKAEEVIQKFKNKPFSASTFYHKLSTVDEDFLHTIMTIIVEAGKVIHEKRDKDVFYKSHRFVVTQSGDILMAIEMLNRGGFKYVYSVLRVNDFILDYSKVIILTMEEKSKETDKKKGNTIEVERKILEQLQGKSDYIAPNFEHFEVYDDSGSSRGYFITQERLSGRTIEGKRSLDQDGRALVNKSPITILKAYSEVMIGLTVIHKENMIHADIKPDNFMFDSEGRARIADFGFTVQLKEGEEYIESSRGTPEYLAPETGDHAYLSKAADDFSAGVSMLTTLCGGKEALKKRLGGKYLYYLSQEDIDKLIDTLKVETEKKYANSLKELTVMLGILNIAEGLVKVNPSKRTTSEIAQFQFKKLIGDVCQLLVISEKKADEADLKDLMQIRWSV